MLPSKHSRFYPRTQMGITFQGKNKCGGVSRKGVLLTWGQGHAVPWGRQGTRTAPGRTPPPRPSQPKRALLFASVSEGAGRLGSGTSEVIGSQLAPTWPGTPGMGPHGALQGKATRPKTHCSQERPPAPLPKAAVSSTLLSAVWDMAPLGTCSHESAPRVLPTHPEGDGHSCVCPGKDPGLTTSGCRACLLKGLARPCVPLSPGPHSRYFSPH